MYSTIQSGDTWHGEIRNRAKDKSYYWVATTIAPLKNVNGEIEQYLAIRTDITERVNAEEALRVSEARTRAILDNSLESILFLNPE
jgi:PAS domain S-box-containing protein